MEKSKKSDRLQEICIFLLSVAAAGISAWLYGNTTEEITKIIILTVVSTGCIIFAMEKSRILQGFLFDNNENMWRFTLLYLLSLSGSVLFPLLPEAGWPYLSIFTGLMLFSEPMTAVCAGCNLLIISMLLEGKAGTEMFFVYFIGGMVGILLFSGLDESFKVSRRILCAMLVQFACLCIHEVLLANATLAPGMFLIPVINVLVNLIFLLILLKFFSFVTIYRARDVYMDINDPECPLLVKLKEFSKEEYFHAIHTAYLCDRIAKRLKLDDAVSKAVGYYHKIGILKGDSTFENAQLVLADYQIPEKVIAILKEYLSSSEKMVSKESAILLFSDTVISSISYLFSKDAAANLNYEKLIQAVFEKKLESGILNYNSISLGELEEMKKILVEEKLYYDFLR